VEAVVATGGGLAFPVDATWLEQAWMCGWAVLSGPVDFISTANLAVRADTFSRLGGFDEALETDEDTDFSRRIRTLFGERSLVASKGMTVVHLGSARTLAQHWHRQYWHAAGVLASVRKHGVDRAFAMTLLHGLIQVAGIVAALTLSPLPGLTAFISSVFIVPVITAASRLRALDCVPWFPHLVLLYTVFYVSRWLRMLSDVALWLRGRFATRS